MITLKDGAPVQSRPKAERSWARSFPQYFLVVTILVGITLAALLLLPVMGRRAVVLIYLLTIQLMALFFGRGPILVSAAVSAIFLAFFFLPPVANLHIANVEDVVLFVTYFGVALVLGELTSRIRTQEKARRQGEEQATALYLLAHELTGVVGMDDLAKKAVHHLDTALNARIALLLPDAKGRLSHHAHPASTYDIAGPEQPVADWAWEHRQPAGRFSDHHPEAEALFLPLLFGSIPLGVLAVSPVSAEPPTPERRQIIDAYCQQFALALDRQWLREDAEKVKLLAESERLSKNLLNSMSHEIRTPLAAIESATCNLVEFKESGLSETQLDMVAEIQQASRRLNGLVGKILDIARLESGRVKPILTLCDVSDLVHNAVKETRNELSRHKVSTELAPGLPLVNADFVLLQQALMNLLSNAAIYTPPGTAVTVSARVREGGLVLAVADRGPGIPPESLPRLFDKFYRAPGAVTGGTGLGLSLVKGFVEAHNGRVTAENRPDGGVVFTIWLPLR